MQPSKSLSTTVTDVVIEQVKASQMVVPDSDACTVYPAGIYRNEKQCYPVTTPNLSLNLPPRYPQTNSKRPSNYTPQVLK